MNRFYLTFFTFFLLASYSVAAAIPVLDIDLDKTKLANGELQTFVETLETKGKGGKKRIIGVVMIHATQEAVWEIIENWDAYGEFVPGLKYYKTIHKETYPAQPTVSRSFIEGYIKIPVPFIRKNYTLDVMFDRSNYFINWQLIDYKRIRNLNQRGLSLTKNSRVIQNIEGFSYLEPFDNGTKTIIYYAPVVEISIPVPKRVERFLSGTIMKGFMEAIKNRAENTQQKTIIPDEDDE
ncbi:MAG: hypothetical protein HQK75_00930 [Candidatus Magnetomorum sp.]|nr:hypothetical protein [Candidatus Magnetomorum sp.]